MSGVRGARWGHVKPCPSWPAYKNHLRLREVPCEPCRQFTADARAARRAAERAEAAYRASAAEWRAEHEETLQRQAVRPLVALLAELFAADGPETW